MSEFMKTASNLEQNFRACLPAIVGREAFAVLEKPGELPSRRVGEDGPGAWLPAGPPGSNPRGVGLGHRERHFLHLNCSFSLQDSLGQQCPAALAVCSQPARLMQDGSVCSVLTDCLWMIE